MSLQDCCDNAAEIIEEEYRDGSITLTEYNKQMQELDREMREYHR